MASANDIMTRAVFTVLDDAPVLDAVRLLAQHRVSGLPVVDREGNLKGVITEKDLLKLLFENNSRKRFVRDFKNERVIHFNERDDIIKICKFFIKSPHRRVPIVNDDNKLVGVISRGDIITEILRIKGI